MDFLQHNGRPVSVRGYTAIFDQPSVPLDRNGGRRELVRRGAFDKILEASPRKLTCVAYHLDGPGFASIGEGNLKIWADNFGLAFQAGPLRATPINRSIVSAIVSGRVRTCSWLAAPASTGDEEINGESIRVIRSFESVDHIGPVDEAAYPATACWCSHENPAFLPWQAQQVIAHWEANRPATRPRIPPSTNAPHSLAAAASQQIAAQPAMTDDEWAGPPPDGFTMDDWLTFGQHIAHGQREYDRARWKERRAS
jgi:phage head maturation protease